MRVGTYVLQTPEHVDRANGEQESCLQFHVAVRNLACAAHAQSPTFQRSLDITLITDHRARREHGPLRALTFDQRTHKVCRMLETAKPLRGPRIAGVGVGAGAGEGVGEV